MVDTYIAAGGFQARDTGEKFEVKKYQQAIDFKQESIVFQSSLKVAAELVAAGKADQVDTVIALAYKLAKIAMKPDILNACPGCAGGGPLPHNKA